MTSRRLAIAATGLLVGVLLMGLSPATGSGQATATTKAGWTGHALDFDGCRIELEDVVADLPVVLRVEIPNPGTTNVELWLTGPGKYLGADQFSVRLTRPGQAARTVRPLNGQFASGAMRKVVVPAGEALRVPLTLEPLGAGSYNAELLYPAGQWSTAPARVVGSFKFDVVTDPAAHGAWIQRRIADVRRADPFAASVCLRYNVEPVVTAMLDDLSGNDAGRALSAARLLELYHHLGKRPPRWNDDVLQALQKRAEVAQPDETARELSAALVRMAAKDPQPQFLPAIIRLSRSEDSAPREAAIYALQSFRQPEATERLVEVLNTPPLKSLHWIAAHALGTRGDERALAELARSATEQTPMRPGGRPEFELLVMYPDEKVAVDAVIAALSSPDPEIRASAERALNPRRPMIDPLNRDPAPDAAKLTTLEAMRTLLEAREFIVIDETTAAHAPQTVIAFRLVRSASSSHAGMNHLYRKGSLAGKLYALCGLYMSSDPMLREKADALIAEGWDITVVDGANWVQMPVRQVVEKIVSGEYPQRLLRLYPASQPAAKKPAA
jgi:hypothetical protein